MKEWPLSLKCLTGSGILLLLSIFSFMPKLMGVGFIVFIVMVLWNMKTTMPLFSTTEFNKYNDEQCKKAWNEQKRFKSFIYFMVGPMIVVGIIFILLYLYCLLFLM